MSKKRWKKLGRAQQQIYDILSTHPEKAEFSMKDLLYSIFGTEDCTLSEYVSTHQCVRLLEKRGLITITHGKIGRKGGKRPLSLKLNDRHEGDEE